MLRGVLGSQAQKVAEIVRELARHRRHAEDRGAKLAMARSTLLGGKGLEQPDAGAAHAAESCPSPTGAPSPA